MTITPIAHTNSSLTCLYLQSLLLVVLYLCINPNKMVIALGLLTPLLLITILAMIIKGFVDYGGNTHSQAAELLLLILQVFHKDLRMVVDNGCDCCHCFFNDCG